MASSNYCKLLKKQKPKNQFFKFRNTLCILSSHSDVAEYFILLRHDAISMGNLISLSQDKIVFSPSRFIGLWLHDFRLPPRSS
jgi:hypothetical protein